MIPRRSLVVLLSALSWLCASAAELSDPALCAPTSGIWPGLSATEPCLAQRWEAAAQVFVWAKPGQDGDFSKPANWLVDGKPANRMPNTGVCDLVLPQAPDGKAYCAGRANLNQPEYGEICSVRHIYIGAGAALDLGKDSITQSFRQRDPHHRQCARRKGRRNLWPLGAARRPARPISATMERRRRCLANNLTVQKTGTGSALLLVGPTALIYGCWVESGSLILGPRHPSSAAALAWLRARATGVMRQKYDLRDC